MDNKIGFIGLGSMGSMLVKGFLSAKVLREKDIYISTFTKSKLVNYKTLYPAIHIASDNADLASHCNYIFICVRPLEVKNILSEIKDDILKDSHIVSIAGCVTLDHLGSMYDGMITKVLPTVLSEDKMGVSLICHNNNVHDNNKIFIEKLFNSIGSVKYISETDFELGGDLTSCAPGLIASIFSEFVKAAERQESEFSRREIVDMLVQTLYGTAKMLCERDMNFEEMIARVATKGGITEEGVKVLQSDLPDVFDKLLNVTLNKHVIVKTNITKLFEN